MRDTAVFLPLEKYFKGIGLRPSIVLCQLPLSFTIFVIAVVTAVFSPETFDETGFSLTLLGHLLIFMACLAVPWQRLPAGSFLVIPVLDCLAIGLTREAGGPVVSVVSQLLVFPVIWLALSTSKTRAALAFFASVATTLVPRILLGTPLQSSAMVRILLLPAVMAALAVTAHLVAQGLVRQREAAIRQREALESKDRDLERLYQESRERQILLDAVVETVNVGVWVVGPDGQDILTNQKLRTDRARAEGTDGGEGALPVFFADGETTVTEDNNPIIRAASGESFSEELYWTGTGRGRRAFSATARALRNDGGELKGSVVAFTDVTALVTALAAKDNFVATISHELRTPLTSILGYLELVLDEPDPASAKEELEVIERNATRLLGLVNDLLSVASGGVDLQLTEADFSGVLERSLGSAGPQAQANGVQLVLDAAGPLPALLDPERMGQVVDNLLSNAIKYSPDGGMVTVTARRENGQLVCTVKDTGIGMSLEEQKQAFSKFFRASRARETAIPGAGLGLPISKTIVEGHGGTISLLSAPGAGTTVWFTIPVVQAAS